MTGQPVRANASAEQRFKALLDRRDLEANLADEARDARDLLQGRRRELISASRAERARRDALSDEAREHEANARAIRARLTGGARREGRPRPKGPESEAEKLERLREEVAEAERRLETTPMPIAEEKRLVELTRRKKREADKLAPSVAASAPGSPEGPDALPSDETQLKQLLEEEQAAATRLRQEAQTAHDAALKFSTDIDALASEADLKHAKVIQHRERANEFHEKAMKMRELVIAERAKRRAERDEAAEAMKGQTERVRAELYDEEKLEKETDEAVLALKQKGKLSL